jgi:hypothetical protein
MVHGTLQAGPSSMVRNLETVVAFVLQVGVDVVVGGGLPARARVRVRVRVRVRTLQHHSHCNTTRTVYPAVWRCCCNSSAIVLFSCCTISTFPLARMPVVHVFMHADCVAAYYPKFHEHYWKHDHHDLRERNGFSQVEKDQEKRHEHGNRRL